MHGLHTARELYELLYALTTALRHDTHLVTAYFSTKKATVQEGFHDAVRTPYALRPGRHVGFFWNNKICFNFLSILFEKIKLTVSERTYIIVPMV